MHYGTSDYCWRCGQMADRCEGHPQPQTKHLYSTKQTPRGSVVVLGDRIITDEMTTEEAQREADWLNHPRKPSR
jgi:hypothetical protein